MEKVSAMNARSGFKWRAVPNSSWSDDHKAQFNDKPGYVITYTNKNGEMVALASVIGQPFVTKTEIDANALLISKVPEMARIIESMAMLNEWYYKDLAGVILAAREIREALLVERVNQVQSF